MKKLLVSLALLTALAVPSSSQIFFPEDVPQLPEIKFELKDVIRIVAGMNIIQQESPTFCEHLYGLTNPNTNSIELCSRTAEFKKREILIHELLHVMYGEVGIQTGGPFEVQIEEKAQAIYGELYGKSEQPAK